nr:MAG TPA: PAP Myotubularin-associated protein [Caudoviricetes sp.]
MTSGLTSGCYLRWILKEGQQIGTQRHQHIVSLSHPHHNI